MAFDLFGLTLAMNFDGYKIQRNFQALDVLNLDPKSGIAQCSPKKSGAYKKGCYIIHFYGK